MPTIRRFANCKIAIYADDHFPPHFHIEGRGFRVVVEIETMVVRAGDIRKAAEAMEWAAENVDLLRAEWVRLNKRG
jgi:hypothetical protein